MQHECCAAQACSATSPSAEGWLLSGRQRRRNLPRMRLAPADLTAITAAAQALLPAGSRMMLFGSRTDDSRRGGDIDLLVAPPAPLDAGAQIQLRVSRTRAGRCATAWTGLKKWGFWMSSPGWPGAMYATGWRMSSRVRPTCAMPPCRRAGGGGVGWRHAAGLGALEGPTATDGKVSPGLRAACSSAGSPQQHHRRHLHQERSD